MLEQILRESQARALIFDMDGTLVDNMPYHKESWIVWAKEVGLPYDEKELLQKTHGTIGDITRRLFPEITDEAELHRLGERKEALYREIYAPHLRLIPGLAEFLEEAREAGVPMAVATAGDWTNIRFTLGGLGITDYFQSIIGGEDVEKGKPDPEVFLKAAAGLGVAPEDCVVFEDSAAGAEAALRAGMRCIIVNATTDWGGVFGDDSHVLHRARDYFDLKLQEEGNGA